MSATTSASIPLTTTFTPVASCLTDYYLTGFVSLGPPSTTACLPSGWAITSQYFSPGICPSGYSIACSSTVALGTFTETQATCCPSSYLCQTNNALNFFSTQPCTRGVSAFQSLDISVTSSNGSSTTVFPTTILGPGGINAYGISIRFQESDFATTSSTSGSPQASNTASSTATALSNSAMSSGTGTMNMIGIGIALAFAVVFAVATVVFAVLWRKRGKLLREMRSQQPVYQMRAIERSELKRGGVEYETVSPQPVRYPATFVSELDGGGPQTK